MSKKEYVRQWQTKNRDRMLGYYKKYYHLNRIKILTRRKIRRLQKRGPRSTRTSEERQAAARAAARRFDEKRLAVFRSMKEGKQCMDCGESDPACLDFHHRDPDQKEMEIGHAGRYAKRDELLREVAKCDVVCVNCHRKRHARERSGYQVLSPTQRERHEFFLLLRSLARCTSCGLADPEVLDYHHVDPKKKIFAVASKAPKVTRRVLLAEIRKCVVLCANCHRKRHYVERMEKSAA